VNFIKAAGRLLEELRISFLAAEAQLQTTFAAGKVEIKMFFNWGIG
jgi:hypothetical protein